MSNLICLIIGFVVGLTVAALLAAGRNNNDRQGAVPVLRERNEK